MVKKVRKNKKDKSKTAPTEGMGLHMEAGKKKHRMVTPPKVSRNY